MAVYTSSHHHQRHPLLHCKVSQADPHIISSSIVASCCIKPTTMARGNGRRTRGQQNPPPPSTVTDKTSTTDLSAARFLAIYELDHKVWPHMPPGVKSFLLRRRESPNHPAGHVELPELVSFWGMPANSWFTQGREGVIERSRILVFLATKYLEIGVVTAARAIILNAAFLDECIVSTFIACVRYCRHTSYVDLLCWMNFPHM